MKIKYYCNKNEKNHKNYKIICADNPRWSNNKYAKITQEGQWRPRFSLLFYIFWERLYQEIDPDGSIKELNEYLAGILECKPEEVYEEIEVLLNHLIPKKALHEYGVKEEELEEFTEVVMTKQGRLMANNYVKLDRDTIYGIYKTLF